MASDATDVNDPSLAELQPGDLLFWARTIGKPDGPDAKVIHHVAMYLGTEKNEGRPVMINSTDGRSYRGRKANGYGVYDFRIPKQDSLSKLAGFGTPPGIDTIAKPKLKQTEDSDSIPRRKKIHTKPKP